MSSKSQSAQRATMIRKWAGRKSDADLLATLDRVNRTTSKIILAALVTEARNRGLIA